MNLGLKSLFIILLAVCACSQNTNPVIVDNNFINPDSPENMIVIRPNGLDFVKRGSKFPINYIVPQSAETISIKLYERNSFVYTIVNSTYNDGLFKWAVPNELEVSVNYVLKLYNAATGEYIGNSMSFRIVR